MNPEKLDQIRYDAMMDEARESAIETMKEWFFSRFEDPAHRTPYETAEGGYIYIWGGPYDARDELNAKFGGEYDDDLIEAAAADLDRISNEWAPVPTAKDYDEGQEPIAAYLTRALASLAHIRRLAAKEPADAFLNALLFAHVISILEAFLSESFSAALNNEKIFRKFIETHPNFKEEKLSVSQIFGKMEGLRGKATETLHSMIFHRLGTVQRMFQDALDVEFPDGVGKLATAIQKRHDIVHRNCAQKDGTHFAVTEREVEDLVAVAKAFITDLSTRIDHRLLED